MANLDARFPMPAPTVRDAQLATLKTLHDTFRTWTHGAAFHMFITGSYRLGVTSENADIDVVFVTTRAIKRSAVFASTSAGFAAALIRRGDVENVQVVADARVPLIGFTLGGQEFDVLTCHLLEDTLPSREDLLGSYTWMNGLEPACVLSFNGARVTEALVVILRSLQSAGQVLVALRFLRGWAKSRFIYSNKSGYWGGINLALLIAYVAQRHPRYNAIMLVHAFFSTFAGWSWSDKPVGIVAGGTADGGACPIWLQSLEWSRGHDEVMAVLTPCFPRVNSTHSVNRHTRVVLQEELNRCKTLIQQGNESELCAPLDALCGCNRFIEISVKAPCTPQGRAWAGYVEAQVRHLIFYLSQQQLALKTFREMPMWFDMVDQDQEHEHSGQQQHRTMYTTAQDDGVRRAYVVTGSLTKPTEYFCSEHLKRAPGGPDVGTITVGFRGLSTVPSHLQTLVEQAETYAASCAKVSVEKSPDGAFSSSSGSQTPGTAGMLATRFKSVPVKGYDIRKPAMPRSKFPKKFIHVVMHSPALPVSIQHTRVIRPRMCNGKWVENFDVYVGPGPVCFCGVVFAHPNPGWLAGPLGGGTANLDVSAYETWVLSQPGARHVLSTLRGKILACWCVPGGNQNTQTFCHAIVLAKLADKFSANHVTAGTKSPAATSSSSSSAAPSRTTSTDASGTQAVPQPPLRKNVTRPLGISVQQPVAGSGPDGFRVRRGRR